MPINKMTESVSDNVYIGRDLEAMSYAKNYNKWIVELFNPFIGDQVAWGQARGT